MNQCKVKGCSKKRYALGYCPMHYARWRRYKNPFIRYPNKTNIGKCIVEDCENQQKHKHLCKKHYARSLKWGNPNIVKRAHLIGPKNVNWKGGVAEYPNHSLMKKLRLQKLKSVNYKCEICGEKAIEIHHINKDKSDQRLKNFMILCRKCHRRFHGGIRKSKYRILLGMTLKEFAKIRRASQPTAYNLLKEGKRSRKKRAKETRIRTSKYRRLYGKSYKELLKEGRILGISNWKIVKYLKREMYPFP